MTLVTWGDDYDASNTYYAKEIPAERWNGAAKPWFSKAEASRIAEDQAVSMPFSEQFRWTTAGDNFEYEDADGKWWPVLTKTDAKGVALYQMGDGWTWREIERPFDGVPTDEWEVERLEEWDKLNADVKRAILDHKQKSTPNLHYKIGEF